MEFLAVLVLAVAVSIDSLGVGITYGLRSVRFGLPSLLIIGLCTFLLMGVAMTVGQALATLVSPEWGDILGGLILMAIGSWHLLRYRRPQHDPPASQSHQESTTDTTGNATGPNLLTAFRLPYLGIMIQVLRDPLRADVDASQEIEAGEALLLGFALGLDAFGAGFGAALAGFSVAVVPIVAMAAVFFLMLGCDIGRWQVLQSVGNRLAYLPGIMLVLLGVFKVI